MAKRVISFFLALFFSLAVSVPSFAFEVATSSNAEHVEIPAISEVMDSVQPYSAIADITNTVDYDGVYASIQYYTSASDAQSGTNWKNLTLKVDSSGHFVMSEPDDFYSIRTVGFRLYSDALPASGNYFMQLDYASDVGFVWPNNMTMSLYGGWNNVQNSSVSAPVSVQQSSGDLYFSKRLDINSGMYQIFVYGTYGSSVEFSGFPFGGFVKVNFTFTNEETEISSPTSNITSSNLEQNISDSVSGISDSLGGISSDLGNISSSIDSVEEGIEEISSNTGYMVNGLREVADTLEEIVATISNQLSALWDQLYNNMHLPQLANDDKNTELIVEAIDDIELDISADLEAQTDSINQNNDKNTDTIVNGYDSSSLDASNDALSSAMESQEAQEEQILEQISEPLEDFEFDNPITQYLSAFQMFGDFLQDLFVGSGGFKDVINLSFLMPIALIVIGMYRFKGGG